MQKTHITVFPLQAFGPLLSAGPRGLSFVGSSRAVLGFQAQLSIEFDNEQTARGGAVGLGAAFPPSCVSLLHSGMLGSAEPRLITFLKQIQMVRQGVPSGEAEGHWKWYPQQEHLVGYRPLIVPE